MKSEPGCGSGKPERFLEPCILLLLAQRADHGYSLLERLLRYGFRGEQSDAGAVYRVLRRLEREGYLQSAWEEGASGPAKRVYGVTPAGCDLCARWEQTLRRNVQRITRFLDDFAACDMAAQQTSEEER